MDAFHSEEEHIIGDATILKNEGDLIENYARCASSCASICRMKWGASSLALRPDTRQPPRCEPILAGLQRSLSRHPPWRQLLCPLLRAKTLLFSVCRKNECLRLKRSVSSARVENKHHLETAT